MPIYLVDHATFTPPAHLRACAEEMEAHSTGWKAAKHAEFLWKVFIKSGISPHATYLPECIHPKHVEAPKNDVDSARKEAEMVMCGALSELLEKTGMKPTDIDILVTCTSIFCPTPSLASMLINKFKMKSSVHSYHLGGMGCGTGVVGINLMRDLLRAHPNSIAVFVPAEITSYCFYDGEEKNRMVANVLFRMGGAAVMMSNKPSLRHMAKYELLHATRVHQGASDESYNCMSWGPDAEGVNGVFLGKTLISAAGKAIEEVIRKVTPRIMTWRQYGEAAYEIARQKVMGGPEVNYMPDFTQCIDHFNIHAGGYAVLKGIQDALHLPSNKMIPSFATLREYGNTSCSTTWYAFGYSEQCEKIRKGQTIMQLGVGGGVKAGCNIWKALRDIKGDLAAHSSWAHFAANPMTEADLPRGINDGGELRDSKMKVKNEKFEATKAQKAAQAASSPDSSEEEAEEEEIPEAA